MAHAVLSVRRYTEVRALVWDGAGSHRSEFVRSIAMPTVLSLILPTGSQVGRGLRRLRR